MVTRVCFMAVAMAFSLASGCGRSHPAVRTERQITLPSKGIPYDDPRSVEQIRKDNAFYEAVRDGNMDVARQLLASGASANARYIDPHAHFLSDGETGYTALLRASIEGNVEMVKLVLAHKPDVNYARKGNTALYYAAIKDHDEVVRLLKETGAQGDPKRIWLTHELIRAACKGVKDIPAYPGVVRDMENAPEIATIVEQGADVNWADPNGHTPLMYAANLGLVENVRTLLAHGADVSLKSKRGATALSLAEGTAFSMLEERKQVVELLTEHRTKKP